MIDFAKLTIGARIFVLRNPVGAHVQGTTMADDKKMQLGDTFVVNYWKGDILTYVVDPNTHWCNDIRSKDVELIGPPDAWWPQIGEQVRVKRNRVSAQYVYADKSTEPVALKQDQIVTCVDYGVGHFWEPEGLACIRYEVGYFSRRGYIPFVDLAPLSESECQILGSGKKCTCDIVVLLRDGCKCGGS